MTKCNVHETALTWLVYELLSCRFGRFRLHTSLRLRALIRSWQGVYVCKFRSTRTRFQFKKTLPGEHSPENFCCVGPHFQACMNLADVFCLRCFSEARKKHFRRNFRKCSRMRAIVISNGNVLISPWNCFCMHHCDTDRCAARSANVSWRWWQWVLQDLLCKFF